MRALVVGMDSKLGRCLVVKLARAGHDVVATTRRDLRDAVSPVSEMETFSLDLLAPELPPGKFDVVYLVAAITRVVDCESSLESWRVNADGPASLAVESAVGGSFPVFVSSDAVERAPHLTYSKQKAYAEVVTLAMRGAVVRPARIDSDRYDAVAEVLLDVGERRQRGIHRWP